MPSEQTLQAAAEDMEQEHEVEVRQVGSKVALYVDGKMVVKPDFADVKVVDEHHAILVNLAGKEKVVKL